MAEPDLILGELRALRRDYDEISLRLRVDTPWVKLREQVGYALHILRDIPMLARTLFGLGVLAFSYGVLYRHAKALAIGVDLILCSLMFVGSTP